MRNSRTPSPYYSVRIKREELRIAYEHRCRTGEPIQSFIRRLIRESQGGNSENNR